MEDTSQNGCHELLEISPLEISPTTGINQLPEEILIMIIAHLALDDRKNTRLVCRRWLDVNNIRKISKKEKFFCCGGDDADVDVDMVSQTIQNSKKSILNLDFCRVDFSVHNGDRLKFLVACSQRIESLSFKRCNFSEDPLPFVILHCVGMKSLAISHTEEARELCETNETLLSGRTVETLKKLSVRRMHLRTFKLEAFNRKWLSYEFLRVLLEFCPNLDDFVFRFGGDPDQEELFRFFRMCDWELCLKKAHIVQDVFQSEETLERMVEVVDSNLFHELIILHRMAIIDLCEHFPSLQILAK